jgi:hypothetical protein
LACQPRATSSELRSSSSEAALQLFGSVPLVSSAALQLVTSEVRRWSLQLRSSSSELRRWSPKRRASSSELRRWSVKLRSSSSELRRWSLKLRSSSRSCAADLLSCAPALGAAPLVSSAARQLSERRRWSARQVFGAAPLVPSAARQVFGAAPLVSSAALQLSELRRWSLQQRSTSSERWYAGTGGVSVAWLGREAGGASDALWRRVCERARGRPSWGARAGGRELRVTVAPWPTRASRC